MAYAQVTYSTACDSTYINETTGCQHFNIVRTVNKTPKQAKTVSAYTSQGKRKARPCDPIRSIEDIQRMEDHILTTGCPKFRLRNHALFVVGISLGIRGGDLLNLRIRDVLDEHGVVREELLIHESKTCKMHHPHLNQKAQEAIVALLKSMGTFDYEDYLFVGRNGKLDPDSLYNIMRKLQKELVLPYHLGAHSLRKTFAYWNIQLHRNDMNIMTSLMGMLNHSSQSATLHYVGQTAETQARLYSDLEVLFDRTQTHTHTNTQSSSMDDKLSRILAILEEDE